MLQTEMFAAGWSDGTVCCPTIITPHTSHLTLHTSHLTPHTSHLTPHTSHLTPHTPAAQVSLYSVGSSVPWCTLSLRSGHAAWYAKQRQHSSHTTLHTSHLTPHTSHLTPHTSHLTPHTSHLTPHTSHLTQPRALAAPAPLRSHGARLQLEVLAVSSLRRPLPSFPPHHHHHPPPAITLTSPAFPLPSSTLSRMFKRLRWPAGYKHSTNHYTRCIPNPKNKTLTLSFTRACAGRGGACVWRC
jgi:hypothetical protein